MKIRFATLLFAFSITACAAQNNDPKPTFDRQQITPIGDIKLESGNVINDCRIGYRTYGLLNSAKSNVVLFLTWFGGTAKKC